MIVFCRLRELLNHLSDGGGSPLEGLEKPEVVLDWESIGDSTIREELVEL